MFDLLFRFSGPMTARQWWGYSVGIALLFSWSPTLLGGHLGWDVPPAVGYACQFAGVWSYLAGTAKRLRMRGESPWLSVASMIPIVGTLWAIKMCGTTHVANGVHAKAPRRNYRMLGATAGFLLGVTGMLFWMATTRGSLSNTGTGMVGAFATSAGALLGAFVGTIVGVLVRFFEPAPRPTSGGSSE
jgi:uncharacterized membrane protein YhaH (DUF805 family)